MAAASASCVRSGCPAPRRVPAGAPVRAELPGLRARSPQRSAAASSVRRATEHCAAQPSRPPPGLPRRRTRTQVRSMTRRCSSLPKWPPS
eukprot:3318534-Prymnesium_polylepis.1